MARWDKDVYSSMVESVGYDDEAQVMFVTFNTGKTYAYQGVSEDEARDASNAASVGSYINENIKGRYSYRRIG